MDGLYGEYLDFLQSLGNTLEQLTQLAQDKAKAVRQDDLQSLNTFMKREQALSLALRNMDKKREAMLAQLGLAGVPLSGLAKGYPEGLRARAKEVAEDLQRQYSLYASAAEVARTTLECNLHQIEKMIAGQEGAGGQGGLTDIRA